MRISIILLAMAILVAYSVPAMSAECAQGQSCGRCCDKGGMECGKAEMACSEGCCGGECKEGCKCGCEGMCKGDVAYKTHKLACPYGERCATCMKRESCEMRGECKMGSECPKMKGGEKGGCPMAGKCDLKDECPMAQGMAMHKGCGMKAHMRPGMHRGMDPGGIMHKTQCGVDMKMQLMPCQKAGLQKAVDKNIDVSFKVMQRYYGDRCMSLQEVNRHMTRMNHKMDIRTRGMLNPMQDAVFPEHMWMLYGSKAWDDSFHPGAKFVFGKLRDKYMLDYGDWGRGRGERRREIVIVEGGCK